jgi:uncharacterized membrane protein HdeD (DUF308 family)
MFAFWVTLARGLLAVLLGIALVVQPDKAMAPLANFAGMYWLLMGLVSVRVGLSASGSRRHLDMAAGGIGMVTGATVVLRHLLDRIVSETTVLVAFGLLIVVTGLFHLLGAFGTKNAETGPLATASRTLGVLEAVLGVAILTSPLEPKLAFWVATIWAVLAGAILLASAFGIRAVFRKAHAAETG